MVKATAHREEVDLTLCLMGRCKIIQGEQELSLVKQLLVRLHLEVSKSLRKNKERMEVGRALWRTSLEMSRSHLRPVN